MHDKQRSPLLAALVLGALIESGRSGKRAGEVELDELLGGCNHKRRLENALGEIQARQAELARQVNGGEVYLTEAQFLEALACTLRGGPELASAPAAAPPTAGTVGGEPLEKLHADVSRDQAVQHQATGGDGATVSAGYAGDAPEPTPGQLRAMGDLVDVIGVAAAKATATLNDSLPRGFFAHVTIARKD